MNYKKGIQFFPSLYNDEIFYSAVARYYTLTGSNNLKHTITDIFGDENVIPTLEFPIKLEHFSKNIGADIGITSDYLINNHTILPYYSIFINEERIEEIKHEMNHGDGRGIKHKVGFIAGSICKKKDLYYCPQCVSDEVDKFGEAYFHRMHQLQGVFICNIHLRPLMKYPVDKKQISRLQFIKFDKEIVKYTNEINLNIRDIDKHKKIVDLASFIMINNLQGWDKKKIYNKFLSILDYKGYITVNGNVRQKDLEKEFINFWDQEFLSNTESLIDSDNEYNWLKVLTRNSNRTTHPLRNILFIIFLGYNGEDFFNEDIKKNNQNLYPCLNPIADHYKKKVISNVIITADYKTRKPVGTFKCSCGFIYSRKMKAHVNSIGSIKEFGHVWLNKLKELSTNKELSLREVARQMGCDPKTAKKYLIKLKENKEVNSKNTDSNQEVIKYGNKEQTYIDRIVEYNQQNPDSNRTEARKNFSREYIWLYRNNKKLLEVLLPEKKYIKNNIPQEIDWTKRDKSIYMKIHKEYNKIINNKEKVRVTKTLLGKRAGELAKIEKYMEKLPLTKQFFNCVAETVEQYQIRRVIYITDNMKEGNEELVKWKIIRKAGLRKPYYENVINKINEIINL